MCTVKLDNGVGYSGERPANINDVNCTNRHKKKWIAKFGKFVRILHLIIYSIVTDKLGYRKISVRCIRHTAGVQNLFVTQVIQTENCVHTYIVSNNELQNLSNSRCNGYIHKPYTKEITFIINISIAHWYCISTVALSIFSKSCLVRISW